MKAYNEIKKELEARKDRSAWSKGVTVYALELLEEYQERAAYEGREAADRAEFKAWLLNGADSWESYSYGGSCATTHVLPGRESHFGEVNVCISQNTSYQCAALDLRLTVTHGNLNVVVHIPLHDFLNEILFQFKPSSVLPFLGDFLPFCFIGVVETHHDTIL